MVNYIKTMPKEPSFRQNGLMGYTFDINNPNLEISFVDSIKGHDKYVLNSVSTHIYYILQGEGTFCIDKNIYNVKTGDLIEIPPNIEFVYKGIMKLILVMNPVFNSENCKDGKDNDLY